MAVCLGITRRFVDTNVSPMNKAIVAFVLLWFLAAVMNMWIGVSQTGYSFQEELPIFLVVFLLPSLVAIVVNWQLLRR